MANKNNGPIEKYATKAQVDKAIKALTDADYKKLMIIAVFYWRNRKLPEHTTEPKELISAAVVATLSGDKKWCRGDVSLIKHLDQAMKNISGHWAGKGLRETRAKEALGDLQAVTLQMTDTVSSTVSSRDELRHVQSIFDGDGPALCLLELKLQEMTMSEIKTELGMSDMEYETVYKRVYRKLKTYKAKEMNDAR